MQDLARCLLEVGNPGHTGPLPKESPMFRLIRKVAVLAIMARLGRWWKTSSRSAGRRRTTAPAQTTRHAR